MMMKNKLRFSHGRSRNRRGVAVTVAVAVAVAKEEEVKWEMRPGGMLVQKRSENPEVSSAAALNLIKVRVAHGVLRYEISVNPQTTFGELKKLVTGESGLQPGEQRLIFKGKERENGEYLDICGVKEQSKIILIQDPESIERRRMEMRRNAKIQTAHRLLDDVIVEVDKIAEQVHSIEKSIGNGNKVAEVQITTLIEMLMRQAVNLDSISAEGDACDKKILQGKRIQKCVETLDVLLISNARIKPVVVTTTWEIFEHSPSTTTNLIDL